jgi:transposase-like protein
MICRSITVPARQSAAMAKTRYVQSPSVAIVTILDTAEVLAAGGMDHRLDREQDKQAGDYRNDHSGKTALTGTAKLELAIPRDRQGGASTGCRLSSTDGAWLVSTTRS